jgi:hypothetical protein
MRLQSCALGFGPRRRLAGGGERGALLTAPPPGGVYDVPVDPALMARAARFPAGT